MVRASVALSLSVIVSQTDWVWGLRKSPTDQIPDQIPPENFIQSAEHEEISQESKNELSQGDVEQGAEEFNENATDGEAWWNPVADAHRRILDAHRRIRDAFKAPKGGGKVMPIHGEAAKAVRTPNYHLKVYHQTSPHICDLIMASTFKKGHGGWCGSAIYFAMSPEETVTKAIAPSSHDGCMLEVTVDVGRVFHAQRMQNCEHFDQAKADREHYDTVLFNPGDGWELVLYDPSRIIEKRVMPYDKKWQIPCVQHHNCR